MFVTLRPNIERDYCVLEEDFELKILSEEKEEIKEFDFVYENNFIRSIDRYRGDRGVLTEEGYFYIQDSGETAYFG